MELNEIKKLLYRENPIAAFSHCIKGLLVYNCTILDTSKSSTVYLTFVVPVSDIGDSKFLNHMDSKLMIRYLIDPNQDNNGETA